MPSLTNGRKLSTTSLLLSGIYAEKESRKAMIKPNSQTYPPLKIFLILKSCFAVSFAKDERKPLLRRPSQTCNCWSSLCVSDRSVSRSDVRLPQDPLDTCLSATAHLFL